MKRLNQTESSSWFCVFFVYKDNPFWLLVISENLLVLLISTDFNYWCFIAILRIFRIFEPLVVVGTCLQTTYLTVFYLIISQFYYHNGKQEAHWPQFAHLMKYIFQYCLSTWDKNLNIPQILVAKMFKCFTLYSCSMVKNHLNKMSTSLRQKVPCKIWWKLVKRFQRSTGLKISGFYICI